MRNKEKCGEEDEDEAEETMTKGNEKEEKMSRGTG